MEHPDGVGAAAHAGNDRVRQPAGQAEHLLARLHPDHPLEVAHHHRERMRAHDRADAVVRRLDRRDPVPECLVDRVLERAAADGDRHHPRAEHLHPGYVERLPPGVLLPHVHHAVQAEQRAGGGSGHAVLSRPGLGDHPGLAHPPGEQGLAEHVIDLVRSGVREVLALEQHPAAACLGAEPPGIGQRRGPAGIAGKQPVELVLEPRIGFRGGIGPGEFVQRGHQRLGREPAAERAEMAGAVGLAFRCGMGRRPSVRKGHFRSPRSAGCEPAVTRSATAARGSLSVTRLSPTSTASAPAAA